MTKAEIENGLKRLTAKNKEWEHLYEELRVKHNDVVDKYNNLVGNYKKLVEISDTIIAENEQTVKQYSELQERYDAITQSNSNAESRNPRGAGRKPKANKYIVKEVFELRRLGTSMPDIARILHISVGLVHKILHSDDDSKVN